MRKEVFEIAPSHKDSATYSQDRNVPRNGYRAHVEYARDSAKGEMVFQFYSIFLEPQDAEVSGEEMESDDRNLK